MVDELKPSEEVAPLVADLRPEDFAPSETDEKLSDGQIRAIINMTHERALYRHQAGMWSPEEEAAYFAGALAVFFACGQEDRIPKTWCGGPPEGVLGWLATKKAEATSTAGVLDIKTTRERREAKAEPAEPFRVVGNRAEEVAVFARGLTAGMLTSARRKALEDLVARALAAGRTPVLDLSATEAVVQSWGRFMGVLHRTSEGKLVIRGARETVKAQVASAPPRVTSFVFQT